MKEILVIGRKDVGENNDARALADAIARESQELNVKGAYFEDIVLVSHKDGDNRVYIHDTPNKRESLTAFNVVILINWSHSRLYLDLAHSIALIASRSGMTVWNNELITARSGTKISQTVRLSYEAIKSPRTIFSLTPQLIKEYIVSDSLGEPFIAKDPLASRGRNNYLCKDWEDFTRQATQDVSYVFQEFIPNDASDLRVFVAGAEAVLAIERRGSGSTHLNNVSQGAAASLIPLHALPDQLKQDTARIAQLFGRELCGIDFMRDSRSGEYIFLEINTTPQIVNGVFAEEKAAAIARALTR